MKYLMESLKVKTVIALLNDTDFDIESLSKIQITIDALIKTKYQTNLRNYYLEKLEEYNDVFEGENMLKNMFEDIKFIKHDNYLLVAEHNKIEYSVLDSEESLRIFKTESYDYWWLKKNNEIHGYNTRRNTIIDPPPKEVLRLGIFLLKYLKI